MADSTIVDPLHLFPPPHDQAVQDALIERWKNMNQLGIIPASGDVYTSGDVYSTHSDTDYQEISKRERQAFVFMKLNLLITMKVLTNKEAARIVMMTESPDLADMTVAEECINQKFSEI